MRIHANMQGGVSRYPIAEKIGSVIKAAEVRANILKSQCPSCVPFFTEVEL